VLLLYIIKKLFAFLIIKTSILLITLENGFIGIDEQSFFVQNNAQKCRIVNQK